MPDPDSASPPPASAGSNPWKVRLVILTLAHLVGTLNIASAMALGKQIQTDLDLSIAAFGLLPSAYAGAQAVFVLFAGSITDRLGVGWTLAMAHILLVIGAGTLSVAESLPLAMVGTAFMGFGYSCINPASAKGVLDWFPSRLRGTVMSVKQTGVPGGWILGAGGLLLVSFFDWRIIMMGVLAANVLSGLLCMSVAERPSAESRRSVRQMLRGILDIARDWNLNAMHVGGSFFNVSQQSFYSYLAIFMQTAVQADPKLASMALGLAQGTSAVARVGWGAVSDRLFQNRRSAVLALLGLIAMAGFAGMAVVAAFLSPGNVGAYFVIGMAFVLGASVAAYAGVILTTVVEAVAPQQTGSAMGSHLFSTAIAGMIGPPLFGWLVDVTGAFTSGWTMLAVCSVAGSAVIYVAFSDGGRKRSQP